MSKGGVKEDVIREVRDAGLQRVWLTSHADLEATGDSGEGK